MTVVRIGVVPVTRFGKQTEKNPEGTQSQFDMVWRAVNDAGDGLPGVMAQGASMGTLFQFQLTGANIDQMLRDVERVIDLERARDGEKWRTAG